MLFWGGEGVSKLLASSVSPLCIDFTQGHASDEEGVIILLRLYMLLTRSLSRIAALILVTN
jgi:hypothetical protein